MKLPMKRNREEISLENEDDDFDKETAVDSEDSAKEKKAANLAAAVTDALFAEQTAKIEAEAEANQNQNQNSGNSGNGGNSGNEDEETAASSLTAEEKDKIEME